MDEEIKIVRTDRLLVHKISMPVASLNYKIIYRFVEPVPSMWQTEANFNAAIMMSAVSSYADIQGQYFLQRWEEILQSGIDSMPNLTDEEKANIQWMREMKTVEIVECDLIASTDEERKLLLPVLETWRKRLNNGNQR